MQPPLGDHDTKRIQIKLSVNVSYQVEVAVNAPPDAASRTPGRSIFPRRVDDSARNLPTGSIRVAVRLGPANPTVNFYSRPQNMWLCPHTFSSSFFQRL